MVNTCSLELSTDHSRICFLYSFPRDVEVWDNKGKVVHKLASLPLADQIPIEGVSNGPRNYAGDRLNLRRFCGFRLSMMAIQRRRSTFVTAC